MNGVGGPSELRAALARLRGGLAGVALLSAVINILAISSSIYMMLVYDRVLPGQSLATLLSLFGIVTIVYLFYGAFDVLRANMLSDIGAAVAQHLGPRVQALEMEMALRRPEEAARASPIRDLDGIRGFLASAGPAALIDLPWIVFFLAILSAMHIWLGVVTLVGAVLLACLTGVTERVTKRGVATLAHAANARAMTLTQQRRHVELVHGLGMRDRMAALWNTADHRYLTAQTSLSERTATLATIGRVFRIFLQSAVLSVGALLVIDGKASGGVIFASSILSGRALAPVDQAIANWKRFVDARQGWARLDALMRARPVAAPPATELPLPSKRLSVERLTLVPPGSTRITVAEVSFTAEAGDAIAILGPSAAGKSSLLRGLIGVWAPVRGEVRLDAARLDQWEPDTIGRAIGYLPQAVELFAGSVAANIARFEPDPPHDAVLAAAQSAGVHELILQLPQGYGTEIGDEGVHLSAGQRQRIGLARALYRDPFLVLLDEPNSNLDHEGDAALAGAIGAIRARGGIVLVATHRPSVFQAVSRILVLRAGQMQGIGPRDEMLARLAGKAPPPPGAGFSVVPKG